MSTTRHRFSKAAALQALAQRASSIALREKFDRSNGTSQLKSRASSSDEELIRRAVEYGCMCAFEQFAESIKEGFRFEHLLRD